MSDETLADRRDWLGPEPEPDPPRDAASAIWIDSGAWAEAAIQPRPWVSPGYLLRGAVSLLIDAPSAMKSSLCLAWATSMATGINFGDFRPRDPGRVAIYNVEDDQTEQRRRLSAVLRQFNANPADLAARLCRTGPVKIGTLMERDGGGRLHFTKALDALLDLIDTQEIDVLILDPLAELHTADENANTDLRAVIATLRSIAIERNIAILVVHHTRKGVVTPGGPEAARGASAIVGAVRVTLTLCTMTAEEAEGHGLPATSRHDFVRLDDAKQNYAEIGDLASA